MSEVTQLEGDKEGWSPGLWAALAQPPHLFNHCRAGRMCCAEHNACRTNGLCSQPVGSRLGSREFKVASAGPDLVSAEDMARHWGKEGVFAHGQKYTALSQVSKERKEKATGATWTGGPIIP